MDASITLPACVTLIFALLGTAKITAVALMRELPSDAQGHGPRKHAPAIGCGVLVASDLAAPGGAIA
jgi:hypothetical protein